MDEAQVALIARQKCRYRVLRFMFDSTIGVGKDPETTRFEIKDIAGDLSLPKKQVGEAIRYLEGKGLVVLGQMFQSWYVSPYYITHRGIVEIEQSIEFPDRRTQHFLEVVIQNFYGDVGSVQTGPNATANVGAVDLEE